MSDQQAAEPTFADPFAPATKTKARGRFGLYGVSSSGKTETALLIAMGLCPGGNIALLDTEAGSASKYADRYVFTTAVMRQPFSPERLAKLIAGTSASKDVMILDGISPFWDGPGGVMSIVDASKQRGPGGGWKDGTPAQNLLVQAILNAQCHIILTMRAKSDTVIEQQDGKQVMRKLGLKPIQRDGVDYELDLLAYMDVDHSIQVEKSRAAFPGKPWHLPNGTRLEGGDISLPSDQQPAYQLGVMLRAWLEDGVPAPEPAAAPPAPPPAETFAVPPTPPAAPAAPIAPPAAIPTSTPSSPAQPPTSTIPPSPPPSSGSSTGSTPTITGTPELLASPAPAAPATETPAAPISVPPAPTPAAPAAAAETPVQPAQQGSGPITAEQATKLQALCVELRALRPDVDWPKLLAEKCLEWYPPIAEVALLNRDQVTAFLERVEATLLAMREKAAATTRGEA